MGREPLQLGAREALVTCVACHPRQAVVAAGYQDGTIQLLGFEDAEEGPLRDGSDDPVSALAWDQAGTRLAFGTEAGAGGIVELAAS